MPARFDAKFAYALGGVFRERVDRCEKCKCTEFTKIDHPKEKGLVVLECLDCKAIYVTVDREGFSRG